MNDEYRFYTPSMASVYAAQGHVEQAKEIYQYLLKRSPERQDLADALAVLEKTGRAGGLGPGTAYQADPGIQTSRDLRELLEKWIRILVRYKHLHNLQKGAKEFEKNSDRR